MKRYIILVTVAALAMMATSCNKENENMQGEVKQMPLTITAGYEGSNAKVAYSESGNNITATWEDGDQILVAYDGHVSTLTLSSGAGTDKGTFSGTLYYTHTPSTNSMLSCYVKNVNNPGMVIDNGDGTIVYSDATFLTQNGSMASAASRNTYFGMATYGDGTNVRCTFSVNTSMCKFNLTNVSGDNGSTATVEYMSGSTTVAKATISVTSGDNLVYLAVPAGSYSGVQKIVYTCGGNTKECTLSSTSATFAAGHTYGKDIVLTRTITWTYSDIRGIDLLGSSSTTIKEIKATTSGPMGQWYNNTISAMFGITVTFSSTYTFSKIEFTCDNPGINISNWSYSGGKLVWQGTPATSVSVSISSGESIRNISNIDFTVQ